MFLFDILSQNIVPERELLTHVVLAVGFQPEELQFRLGLRFFLHVGYPLFKTLTGVLLRLWYGLGRQVITPTIGNWPVSVWSGWHFLFGIIVRSEGREPFRYHDPGK